MLIKDENYYQIQGFMINRLGLKGTELNVYALIYGFSQDGESSFTGSRQYLCDFTGATKRTIDCALKNLVDNGLIEKRTTLVNGVVFNTYKAVLQKIDKCAEIARGVQKLHGGGAEIAPNNNIYNIEPVDKSIVGQDPTPYTEIINYLNEKTGKHFKANNKTTVGHINARLKEGYTVDDFKKVIDNKVAEWKGDPKMCGYLRPETLFAGHFESYINEDNKTAQNVDFGAKNGMPKHKAMAERDINDVNWQNLYDDIDSIDI